MKLWIRDVQDYTLTVGGVELHMSEYKIAGSCVLSEQGTASGEAAVSACFPKGTVITLKGRLIGQLAETAVQLDKVLHSGEELVLHLGEIICRHARLIRYTFGEGRELPELMLVFYANDPFGREETEE